MQGSQISHYRLIEQLGEGTYGTVWKAVHVHDPQLVVAVKVVHPALAVDPDFVSALKAECRLLSRLHHPGIVGFRDLVLAPGQAPAMVLELVEGGSLEDLLAAGSKAPEKTAPERVVFILDAVLDALGHAHSEGVVHRDVKPGNVLLDARGRPRVVDFGIARAADSGKATRTGAIVGTLDYVAPEVIQGTPASPASDVYAAGLVAWELIAGRRACPDGPLATKLGWHIGVGPSDLRVVRPGCPDWLAEVLAILCARDPAARPADGAAALALLRERQTGGARDRVSSEPSTPPPRSLGPQTVAVPRSSPPQAHTTPPPQARTTPPPQTRTTPPPQAPLKDELEVDVPTERGPPEPGRSTGVLSIVGGVALVVALAGGAFLRAQQEAREEDSRAAAEAAAELAAAELARAAAQAAANPEAREEAAAALLKEASAAVEAGDVTTTKARLATLEQEYSDTKVWARGKRMKDEFDVIGKYMSSAWRTDVERWYQGEDQVDLRQGTVVVVFWEVWCPYSKKEVPVLNETWGRLKSQGLQVVGFTRITKSATEETLLAWMREKAITMPIAKEDGDLSELFAVSGIPAAAVLKDGVVVWRGHPGRLSDELLGQWL